MTGGRIIPLLLLPVAAVGALIFFGAEIGVLFRFAVNEIAEMGPLGPVLYLILYVLACLMMLPASVLTLGAGAVWGLGWGAALVSLSAILGATASFLVGRYFARGWVERKLAANPKLGSLDEAVGREGWKLVFLMRLSPVIPFNLLNYAFGLTRVGLGGYVAASWLGMMPGVFLYSYLGTLAGGLAASGGGKGPGSLVWGFRLLGLAATVAITFYLTRMAKRALSSKV